MNQLETFALSLIGAAYTLNQEQIDHFSDTVAARVTEAVKNTETKIDDTAADVVAKMFRRIADGIDAGIASPADKPA